MSSIEFRLHDLPADGFDNAASIRLQNITAEEFIETRHRDESPLATFKRLILEIIPHARQIDVFSIQNHEQLPRTVDVYYALHGSGYLSKIKINGLVEIARAKLEEHFHISQIGIDECLNSDQQCFTVGCLNTIEIQPKQPYLINANQTSFVGLHLRTVAQCACETDIHIQQERQREEFKTHKYCLNGGHPMRDNHHLKCQCPEQTLYNGGDRCQLTSISFDGKTRTTNALACAPFACSTRQRLWLVQAIDHVRPMDVVHRDSHADDERFDSVRWPVEQE